MRYGLILFLALLMASCTTKYEWEIVQSSIVEGLHDIELIGNKTVLAYSYGTGNLYKSADKGENWEKIYQFDSIYFEQIQFIDKKNGWIAGSPNIIFRTSNGGKDWTDISIHQELENPYPLVYGMYFKDKNTGFVTAVNKTKNGYVTNVYKTIDGGNNWKLVNAINETLLNIEKIGKTLYATGDNVIVTNINKVENWEYAFRDTSKTVGQIRDLEVGSKGKIIAVSFNGFVIIKNKKMWRTSKISENRIRSIAHIKDDKWLSAGDSNKEQGNLFESNDDGKSWQIVEGNFPDIHRIAKTNKKLWCVGKDGWIMAKMR